jgi:hypothetical protein
MLVALEGRLSRADVAAALGVDERRLDEIASGYAPSPDVAERLRSLASSKPDRPTLRDRRTMVIAFVAMDLVFFAGVAAFVLLR